MNADFASEIILNGSEAETIDDRGLSLFSGEEELSMYESVGSSERGSEGIDQI